MLSLGGCKPEEFVGPYHISDISASTIVHAIKDCLLRLNLQWCQCRGQCFDAASNMAGHRSGVATELLAVEKRVLLLTAMAIHLIWLFVTLSKV